MADIRNLPLRHPVGPVVLGLWPIAGITSGAVSEADAEATILAALEAGITTFDTAFSYGYQGQSDRLLGAAIAGCREAVNVIGKVGQRWTSDRQRVIDCSPRQLIADARESLQRTGIDQFDLLMLHAVDPGVPVGQAAETMAGLRDAGLARAVGVCNITPQQLKGFADACVPAAIQCPLNMLQRQSQDELIPWCQRRQVDVHAYWVLMKGILAGKITRGQRFGPGDARPRYAIYQGAQRQRTHALVDRLQRIAAAGGLTVAQLAIGWALAQPGVTAALVGAKRPEQIRETAAARPLASEVLAQVEQAVAGL